MKLVCATKYNIPAILEYMEAFNAIDAYPFDREQAERNIQTFISNQELGRLWLIELSGKSIGYLALTFGFSFEYGGRDAFIDEFFLDEAFRAKGHGSRVMGLVEIEAIKLNVKAIHLEVEAHNKMGKSIYLKSGYAASDRSLMTKRLD